MIAKKKELGLVSKLYDLFISILRSFRINSAIYILFLLIESIQLFSYTYNCLYEFSDPSYDIMKFYSQISTYFRIFIIIANNDYFEYVAAIVLAIPIVVVLFGALMTAITRIRHKPYPAQKCMIICYNFLAYMLIISERVTFIPYMMIALRAFSCGSPKTNIGDEDVVSSFEECWTAGHFIFVILSTISILCFIILMLFSLFALSLNYFESPLPWADDSILTRLITLLQKITLSILLIFDPTGSSKLIGMILLLALCLAAMFFKLREPRQAFSYPNYITAFYRDLTFLILLAIYLIESEMNFTSYSIFVIPFFLTPFMTYAIEGLLSFKKESSIPDSGASVMEIETYIFSLLSSIKKIKLIEENSSINECYLISILNIHFQKCETKDCICKALQISQGKSSTAQQNWISFVKQQLDEFIQKVPKDPDLFIISACINYYWQKNCFLALKDLECAYELRPSIPTSVSIFYVHREIEEDMIYGKLALFNEFEGSQSIIDISRASRFMKLFSKFIKEVEDCTANNILFWTTLLSDTPETSLLNRLGNKIYANVNLIHDLYEKIMIENSKNRNFLYKYAIFLRYVVFDEITSNKLFNKLWSLKEDHELRKRIMNSSFTINSEKTVLIRVAGNNNELGKIMDVNFEATKELKYTKEELKRLRLNQLMTSPLAIRHDEWVKLGYRRLIFSEFYSLSTNFLCNKDGYVNFINYFVSLVPSLKDGLNFILAIRFDQMLQKYVNLRDLTKRDKKFIGLFYCDEKDNIVAINENIGVKFHINPKYIKPNITIQSVIPELNNKAVEEKARSMKGYKGFLTLSNIESQLGDVDKVLSDEIEKEPAKSKVWLRVIEEIYGAKVGVLVKIKIVIIIDKSISSSSEIDYTMTRSLARNSDNFNNSEGNLFGSESGLNCNVKSSNEIILNKNVGSNAIGFTVGSRDTNINTLAEIKASLYDKKTPFTIKLLMYTIWLLYLILIIFCIVDWVISYMKANESKRLLNFIGVVAKRLNGFSTITSNSRTIDLIARELEENKFYGDDFYTQTRSHLIDALNDLSNLQNYLMANPSLYTSGALEQERAIVPITNVSDSIKSWGISFGFEIQRYLRLAVQLSRFETRNSLMEEYDSRYKECSDLIYYLVNDSSHSVLDKLLSISLFICADSVSTLSDTKKYLLIILIVSMGVAVIGYGFIIPRILNVIRHRAAVMQSFADIPNSAIQEMLNGINQLSIESLAYDRKKVEDNLELNFDANMCITEAKDKTPKSKDEVIINKTTEIPLAEQIKTATDDQIMSAQNKANKKKKLLKNSDQRAKRISIIIITGVIIGILFYYAGSIWILFVMFSGYDKFTNTIMWVAQRQAAMTLGIFYLRELVIEKTEIAEKAAEQRIMRVYLYEQEVQNIKVAASGIYENYIELVNRLDSNQFCDVISNELGDQLTKCKDFMGNSMERGMQNNVYQVLVYLNSVQNSYNQHKDENYSFPALLKLSNWDVACIFLSLLVVYMKNEYLDLAYVKLVDAYMLDGSNYVNNTKTWTSIRNACFLGTLLLVYIFAILQFINQLKQEIWKIRGLLNLIPMKFFINNPNLKENFISN